MPIIKAHQTHAPNRIMIVEDDLSLLLVIKHVVASINPKTEIHAFTQAEGAQAALQKNERYALILSDHHLAGAVTGIQFWKYCQKNHDKNPFIILSSISCDEFFKMIGPARVAPIFLSKPMKPSELKDILLNYIPRAVVTHS